MGKEKFTVSWIMADEPLLKLKEPDKTYDIAEDVFKFITSNELHKKEDFQVEVEIDKNLGENGTITSLKEVGGTEPPKEEAKEEQTVGEGISIDLTVKELTVAGVSPKNKGVTFKEEEKVWYTLDDSIDAQEFKDKYTKRVVEVSVKATEKGNDLIVSFTAKEEDVSEDTSKDTGTSQKRKGNATGNSIEAQASLKCAKAVVSSMVDKDSKPDFVLTLLTKISEHSFQIIQNLKNKE